MKQTNVPMIGHERVKLGICVSFCRSGRIENKMKSQSFKCLFYVDGEASGERFVYAFLLTSTHDRL